MNKAAENHYFKEGSENRSGDRPDLSPETMYAIDCIVDRKLKGQSCCVLNEEAKEAAPVLFSELKAAGDTNIQKGINKFFDNFYYWKRFRSVNAKVFDLLLKAVVLGIISFIGWLIISSGYLSQ